MMSILNILIASTSHAMLTEVQVVGMGLLTDLYVHPLGLLIIYSSSTPLFLLLFLSHPSPPLFLPLSSLPLHPLPFPSSPSALDCFFERTSFSVIIRAHQPTLYGIDFLFPRPSTTPPSLSSLLPTTSNPPSSFTLDISNPSLLPRLVTLFSCPHYAEKYDNRGCFILLDPQRNTLTVKQFTQAPRPYFHQGFHSLFDLTMHSVVECILHIIYNLLSQLNDRCLFSFSLSI